MFFFVLFCCFCRIWLTKCPQTENKKEQKRSCRRENRKMSFVFFVVGPPPPPNNAPFQSVRGAKELNPFLLLLTMLCTFALVLTSLPVIMMSIHSDQLMKTENTFKFPIQASKSMKRLNSILLDFYPRIPQTEFKYSDFKLS